tara:strand:- start:54 stop:578 length:525 start_codon:yes stop_codon:yes gene_type:complete
MTKNFKEDFLNKIKKDKEMLSKADVQHEENLKINDQNYKRVITKEFVSQIQDAIQTIKDNLKGVEVGLLLSHLIKPTLGRNTTYILFSIKEKTEEDYFTKNLELSFNFGKTFMTSSSNWVLQKRNDLGDMEDTDSVIFPNYRAKTELDEEDIKEIHTQFIRAIYELAKEYTMNR